MKQIVMAIILFADFCCAQQSGDFKLTEWMGGMSDFANIPASGEKIEADLDGVFPISLFMSGGLLELDNWTHSLLTGAAKKIPEEKAAKIRVAMPAKAKSFQRSDRCLNDS